MKCEICKREIEVNMGDEVMSMAKHIMDAHANEVKKVEEKEDKNGR